MPLMQLRTLVLPAPLGPISANSSPASTANETLSRTTRPPKRSDRFSISSSAIPPPATPILLDGPIAPAFPANLPEIKFLDFAVIAQPFGVALQHDTAVFQHVAMIGNRKRHRCILFDDGNADAELAANMDQPLHQVVNHDRRKTQRKLVDQEQLGMADQRAAEREHLPLAARKQPADPGLQLAKQRKELVHQRLAPPTFSAVDPECQRRR